MKAALVAFSLAACAIPLAVHAADDPRFQTIPYAPGGLFHVQTTPEASQTVLFAPGERVTSVIISDPGAYVIGVTGSGDGITLKANGSSALAVVSVQTSQRAYQLELVPGRGAAAPSVVQFSYTSAAPPAALPPTNAQQASGFGWRISGSKILRPSAVRDDGTRTFIEWDRGQAQPAVFAIGAGGKEEIVDAYVRGGIVTIDRVYPELVFRIDKTSAKAVRTQEKPRRDK